MKNEHTILYGLIGILIIGLCGVLIALGNLLYQSFGSDETPASSPTHPLFTGSLPTERPWSTPTKTPAVIKTLSATLDVTPAEGRIAFACRREGKSLDDICVMNADGSGYRRITSGISAESYYPSISPDGRSVIYSSNRTGSFQIFEQDLENGAVIQLTQNMSEAYAPEISPDGSMVVFAVNLDMLSTIWLMERDGSDPHMIFRQEGKDAVDPTWSPDGKTILFAMGTVNSKLLYTIDLAGKNLTLMSNMLFTRGRSDWSADGQIIGAYGGAAPHWEIFFMNPDGSNLRQMTYSGRNLAPSFSPDSKWMVYTSYGGDNANLDACEIYIMRVDGSENIQLTDNDICDWQPRWGP